MAFPCLDKTLSKSSWGGKCFALFSFVSVFISLSLKRVRVETQAETVEQCCLPACFLCYLPYAAQTHLVRDGTTHSGMGIQHELAILKVSFTLSTLVALVTTIPHLRFLLLKYVQVRAEFTTTHHSWMGLY